MRPSLTALLASFALAAPAFAEIPLARQATPGTTHSTQDAPASPLVITGGVSLEFSDGEYGRGTGGSLSTEAYVEAEINGFYLGIWGLMTDEETDNEVDYYLGYRHELPSGFSYDIGYTRYTYPRDGGDCCGEVTLGLFAPVGDKIGLGLDLAYDPEAEIGNAYISGEYYLNDKWTLSANYGIYEVEEAPSEREWDFGAGYAVTDEVAIDLRWYEGTEYDGYLALAVSFDTTLFGN